MKTGGKQYRVRPGDELDVEKLPVEEGSYVEIGDILAVSRDGELTLGNPMVADASVLAQVRSQYKDTKILVFKYKRKVRYRRKKGHRQPYTRLYITSISHAGEEIGVQEWPDEPSAIEEPVEDAVVATAVAVEEPEEAEVEETAEDDAPVEVVEEAAEESEGSDEAPVAEVADTAEGSAESDEVAVAEVADTADDESPAEVSGDAQEETSEEPEAPNEDEDVSDDSDDENQSRGEV